MDLDDMRLFVRAVTDGSLSAAGRELGLSPAVASKRLSRLEQTLGVRLLQRSSRRLSLTSDGACYYERCLSILADIDEANAMVGRGQLEVRGALHVSASLDLGRKYVGPRVAEFAAMHPELSARISTSDAMLDVFEHGVDVAVRSGAMSDSRLISRRLALNYRVLCASPEYLQQRGTPANTDELAGHACLMLHRPGRGVLPWMLQTAEGPKPIRVEASITTDSGDLMRELAVAGHGIAFKSIWDIADDVETGRLLPLLTGSIIQEAHIYAIYPSRDFLPARIRLFTDFLQQRMQQREPAVLGLLRMQV